MKTIKVSVLQCRNCSYWNYVSLETKQNMLKFNNCGKRYNHACERIN